MRKFQILVCALVAALLVAVLQPSSAVADSPAEPLLNVELGLPHAVGFSRHGALVEFQVVDDEGNAVHGPLEDFEWDVTGMPPGTEAYPNGSRLEVEGTPTEVGIFSIAASVSTPAGTATAIQPVAIQYELPGLPGVRDFDHVPNGAFTSTVGEPTELVFESGFGYDSKPWGWEYQLVGLPPGMRHTSSIHNYTSGIPTEPGTYSVAVYESEWDNPNSYYSTFTWTITEVQPVVQSQTRLDGVVNFERYAPLGEFTVVNSTGNADDYEWEVSGLPAGAVWYDKGDRITLGGIPTEAGAFDVTATVTTANGTGTDTLQLTTYEVSETPDIEGIHLVNGDVITMYEGSGYGFFLEQTLSDRSSFQVIGLPPGAEYVNDGGLRIFGESAPPGVYDVVIFESDLNGGPATAWNATTWYVYEGSGPVVESRADLDGVVGFERNGPLAEFAVADAEDLAHAYYRWTVFGLPPGTTWRADGPRVFIEGTPTESGVYSPTAKVTTPAGAASASQLITIHADLTDLPGIEWFEHVPGGEISSPVGQHAGFIGEWAITNGNQDFQVHGLPPGITDNNVDNDILGFGGTPTEAGVYQVTVFESDGAGGPEAFYSTFTWTITAADPNGSDLDGDGVPDANDACPVFAGENQTQDNCQGGNRPGVPFAFINMGDRFGTSWDVDPYGTDTATTGIWDFGGIEESVFRNTVLQPGTSGRAMATDPLRGSSVGARDIDGGETTARSPEELLIDDPDMVLRVDWYFGHVYNADQNDNFELWIESLDSDQRVQILNVSGNSQSRSAEWETAMVDVTRFAGERIQVFAQAGDRGSASLVEAGFDNIRVSARPFVPRFFQTEDNWFSKTGHEIDVSIEVMNANEDSTGWIVDGLPPGIAANTNGRQLAINGTLTEPGTYEVTIGVAQSWGDINGTANKTFVWTVDDNGGAPNR